MHNTLKQTTTTPPAAFAPPIHQLSAITIKRTLAIILFMAVLVRVGSALFQGEAVETLPGVYDQVSYDSLARRVLAGYGFSFGEDHWPATRAGEPTAHWSFLYTLYLAGVYALFGAHPLIARLIQAVIAGLLHTWLAWRIGRRLFGDGAGLVAAVLSALYIYFFYYAGSLITEPFYLTCVLWVFDITLRLAAEYPRDNQEPSQQPGQQRNQRWRQWLELGLAVGITTLFRQLFLLFVPFLYLWLWWQLAEPLRSATRNDPGNGTPWWQRWLKPIGGFAVATVVIALLIVPWTARNYRAFGTLVPLNTNAGYVFFWGNHPIYGTHFIGILPFPGPSYYELIPKELLPLNEAKLDQALLKLGLQFIQEDPKRYLLLSISRVQEYFKFWPSADSGRISNLARVGSFGLMLPFMLYGLYLTLFVHLRTSTREQRAAIFLLCLFMVVYTGIHLLTWTLIRYRLPVDTFLLLFAAVGLLRLFLRLRTTLAK
jgi:hypothetical protein